MQNVSEQLLISYFQLIIGNKASSEQRGRRAITTQGIERYIFCLNRINEANYLPLQLLIRRIKEGLEKNRNYHIDRRTVKAIIGVLETEGLLKMIAHHVRDPEQHRGIPTVLVVATPGYTLTTEDMDWIEHVWLGRYQECGTKKGPEAKPESEQSPEEPPRKRPKREPEPKES